MDSKPCTPQQAAFLREFVEDVIKHGLPKAMCMYETCYDPNFYEEELKNCPPEQRHLWEDTIHSGDDDDYMPIGALLWDNYNWRKIKEVI